MSKTSSNLSSVQLKRAAVLAEQIEKLQAELSKVLDGSASASSATPAVAASKVKRNMSAAGRARIAAAQKARWAKFHAAKTKKTK